MADASPAPSIPAEAAALKHRGAAALRAGDLAEAARCAAAALRIAPDHPALLLDLAAAYEAGGRLDDAWNTFGTAVRAAPRDPAVLGGFLGLLTRLGKLDNILPLYREALAVGWRDLPAALALGNTLIGRYQYAEAAEVFESVLAQDPRSDDGHRGLGIALAALKRFAEATRHLEPTVTPPPGQAPTRAHVWSRVHLSAAAAGLALNQGRWADATRLLSESIDSERGLLPQTVPPPEAKAGAARPVHRLLYIEIELKAREFEARALLALHAAAQGLDVVIGQKRAINRLGYGRLPPGIMLVKTMNGTDVQRVKEASKAGHMVVVLDEEAFGGSGRRPLWMRLNTDPQALAAADMIIAQGREYADLLTQVFPDAADRIRVLGNPRVDLYRPEFRKAPTPGSAGRRILICSQSQVCNPRAISFPDLVGLHVRGVPMGEDIGGQVIAGTKEVFAFEISMIPQLQAVTRAVSQAFAETPVLFRPHPAEDAGLWERAFAGLANVTVSSAGSMSDALQDAMALVYVRGCATGLEAHFQEVPIVRFDGDARVAEPGDWISSAIGFPARSADDVVAALRRIAAGDSTTAADRPAVARHFHGDGRELVCAGVARGLAAAVAARPAPEPAALAQLARFSGMKITQRAFDASKFPPTPVAEVQALAARLSAVAGLPAPRVEAFLDNVFIFRASG